ncbi:RagB/SusD family nutrient uptake outer membrane protein [Fulvivirga sediminis]|uniref:RagB/SusD family nutrient uptake outer membrane protein n=1 Tax=Fulvivirga sediminis TaxID=2803949 RepID=A0A937F894_9BACT|nr:RagB/SusD family nutrient uptake outer membrane protein [Fulvivirga sediminis]MBL3656115.1 RagB/SusD family nutrient uptake outer membrane protein [Fulvivirga sediminis]
MKLKYILITLLALSSFSCDDYLESEPISYFDLDYVYSNSEEARRGVNSIYVHFSHDGFRSRLSNNMTGNTDIEHQSGWSSDGARYQIWDLNAQINNGDLDYVWTIAYQAIRDANFAIEAIQASEPYNSTDAVEVEKMSHLLGEAYTLRAYWYSILVFYFGDVPFLVEAPKPGVEFNVAKTDRNEILSYVIHDMIKAEEGMYWASEAPYGIEQVNRDYTLGMIARLSLQRGGWYLKPDLTMDRQSDYLSYYDTARMYSKKLIDLQDRQLPQDYKQMFMNLAKFNQPAGDASDILFEVPFAIGEGDVGWNIGVKVESGPYGTSSNYMSIPATYYYSFDSSDVRRDVTCALYQYPNETTNTEDLEPQELVGINGIAQGKFNRVWLDTPPGSNTNKGTGINWPMLRYADVLLMYAEAENEINGPTADAQEMLKRVRQRAFPEAERSAKVDDYVNAVSSSKEAFFDALVDERAWEFGGEMIRKYELIRWNIYAEKVQETVAGLKRMADNAVAGTGQYPARLWVRNEGDELIIYDTDTKAVPADIENWEQRDWLLGLSDDAQPDGYQEWITHDWARYTHPVRYIFPIPAIGIDNSQGVLQNDGYGF